ncbi:MAG: sulfotransferase [Halieaceae bacterium]|nr:sulfotransferase [Halieaceae bacterium]
MYFDFAYYWRVLRHVWGLKNYPKKPRMLLRLLLQVPLTSTFHMLFFLLDYLLFPKLWTQKVEQPVFIVGHGRSGTTLMHRLMSADQDKFSYFLYWEMFFPSLLQKKLIRGLGWIDKHWFGGPVKRRLQAWDERTYGAFRHMHDMSLWNAEEDCFAMTASFVTQQWSTELPLMHVIDLFHVDDMPRKRKRWLHHYKELVKRQLLLNGGKRIHLAKNPLMSGWVDALIETFPDARVVVMMRDPAECLPSLLKLMESSWQGKGWQKQDYARSLEVLTEVCLDNYHYPRAALRRNQHTPSMVVDYRQLTSNPRQTVEQLYAHFGMSCSEEFQQWLQERAELEKKHHSRFEYSLGDYAMTAQRLERELAEFYEEYDWPRPSEQAA